MAAMAGVRAGICMMAVPHLSFVVDASTHAAVLRRVSGLLRKPYPRQVLFEMIARLLERHHWIAYVGLVVILYVALEMIWTGAHALAEYV